MEKEEKEVTYTCGKNAIVHVKRMDDPAIPWIRSSEKLLTESPQGTDYALQFYLDWSREKLVLNVDLEQIETNFSFIVYSLCNLYRTFRIWDSSSITFLITVHRKKGPSHGEMYCKLPLCWVHQNNYEGLKKNSLYRISTVEKKPQRLYPVRFNLSWWAERNGIYNLYIP